MTQLCINLHEYLKVIRFTSINNDEDEHEDDDEDENDDAFDRLTYNVSVFQWFYQHEVWQLIYPPKLLDT